MRVKITDPAHPYCGETGILRSHRKVAGRVLEVLMDGFDSLTEVQKHQVEVLS